MTFPEAVSRKKTLIYSAFCLLETIWKLDSSVVTFILKIWNPEIQAGVVYNGSFGKYDIRLDFGSGFIMLNYNIFLKFHI